MVEFGKESFKVAANYESLIASVQTFAGAETPELIKEIEKFAIENPVANLEASVKSLSALLAQGLSGEESIKVIKGLTEVTGGNVEQFERLTYQLAQVRTRGKLTGDNLKDLAQSGFAPLEFIAQRTGESLVQVQDRLTKGGVSYKETLQALEDATTGTGRFAGRSAAIAKTAAGALANLEDSITTFKIELGGLLAEGGLTDIARNFAEIVRAGRDLISVFKELSPNTKTFFGILSKETARQIPVIGQLITAYDALSLAARTYNQSKTEIGAFDIKKAEAALFPFGNNLIKKSIFEIDADPLQLGIEKQKRLIEDANIEIENLQNKADEDGLNNAEKNRLKRLLIERQKYGTITKDQEKVLKQLIKDDLKASEELVKQSKETTEKLAKAYTDRQSRLADIQDKISIASISENQSSDAIKQKYAIELAAELREIEANKQAIDKEIVVYNSEQAAKKIQLLQTFEAEKTAITELYRINEAKDVKEHNEELVKAEKELKERIIQLRKENIEATFELVRQNFDNEAEILRIRESLAIESINKQFDAEKEAINEKVKLGLNATNLLLELENERQGALTVNEKRFNKERLELNDKYFNEYLTKLQDFTQRAQLVQENDFSRERIALQEQYNSGLIGRRKYYKELEKLDKEQELKRAKSNLTGLIQESVAIQGEILDGNLSADEKEALKKRREQLKVEIEKAGLEVSQIQANQGTEVITKQQEQLQAAADFGVQIAQLAADSMGAILQAQIDAIDNTIAVQEDRLQNARSLAEAGFTANLQQEQDKLELLQQKREAFVRRQVIIDNIARISAQALALANAIAGASTTGPAAPFTIAAAAASVLDTIATSVAQARSFNTGTAWLTPANGTQGRRVDDIPIMANKGEGIIPTAQNERFNAITKAMIEGNPKSIALAALQYPSIKKHLLPDYSFALSKAPNQQANQAQTIVEMRKHIDRLEQLIGGITIVNNSTDVRFDEDGVSKFSTKRAEKIKNIRNKI